MLPRLLYNCKPNIYRNIRIRPVDVKDNSLLQTVFNKKINWTLASLSQRKETIGYIIYVILQTGALDYTRFSRFNIMNQAPTRRHRRQTYLTSDEIKITKYPNIYVVEKVLMLRL
ncbi:hypothetical protein PR048_001991, partial [Dryococelus australis]